MSDELNGTAGAEAGAPESAGQPAGQTAQPSEASAVESKATPVAPVAPNWDDPTNPWRQKYDGIQGNFKQVKTRADELNARLAQLEAERVEERSRHDSERARLTQEAEERRIEALLETDSGPVAQELKRRLDQQRAERQWQAQHLPRVQQEAERLGREATARQYQQAYAQGLTRAAEKYGLNGDEIAAIAAEHSNNFDAFTEAVITKSAEKKAAEQEHTLEERLNQRFEERTRALEAQLRGQQRGTERSPDASVGQPAPNDDTFLAEYAAGRLNGPEHHSKARRLLGF